MTQTRKNPAIRLTRRSFMAGAAAPLVAAVFPAAAAPGLQLNGLYSEPWLGSTSGDLSTDVAEAAKTKKNFAIVWEMRGCPWCKLLHMETFARDDVAAYLQANYSLVQLNLHGSRQIADFDGEKLSEEDLSLKHGINSTPTFQFFRPSDARAASLELGRANFLKPDDLLKLLHFIREKGYEHGTFEEWARQHKNPA